MAHYGKLILACAGSGKTTTIINDCLQNTESKIIVTYTIENYESIKYKFIEINGCIPPFVTIYTWYSFLLKELIKPYCNNLTDHKIKGVLLVNSMSNNEKGEKNKYCTIKESKNFEAHYFNSENRVYTNMISKLADRCLKIKNNVVIKRLKLRAQKFYFDEIQDLEGYDFEVLKLMMVNQISILMVGDIRQKTYSTHNEKKNSKYKGNIKGYMEDICKDLCDVDSTSLNVSYRCNSDIIDFASKLYPEYPASKSGKSYSVSHQGIFFIARSENEKYLEKFKSMQLRDTKKTPICEKYEVKNFGLSKGLAFDRILIYPNKKQISWLLHETTIDKPLTKGKLYVAITRAKYSVAFVIDDKLLSKSTTIKKYIVD